MRPRHHVFGRECWCEPRIDFPRDELLAVVTHEQAGWRGKWGIFPRETDILVLPVTQSGIAVAE